jgi:hypothetical protein
MSALTANERAQLDDVFLSIDSGSITFRQIKKIFFQKVKLITISNLLKFIHIKK